MKKLSKLIPGQEFQQTPKQAAATADAEKHGSKTPLSDAELEQVNAGSSNYVPTFHPEVLLGRHSLPDDTEKQRP